MVELLRSTTHFSGFYKKHVVVVAVVAQKCDHF